MRTKTKTNEKVWRKARITWQTDEQAKKDKIAETAAERELGLLSNWIWRCGLAFWSIFQVLCWVQHKAVEEFRKLYHWKPVSGQGIDVDQVLIWHQGQRYSEVCILSGQGSILSARSFKYRAGVPTSSTTAGWGDGAVGSSLQIRQIASQSSCQSSCLTDLLRIHSNTWRTDHPLGHDWDQQVVEEGQVLHLLQGAARLADWLPQRQRDHVRQVRHEWLNYYPVICKCYF